MSTLERHVVDMAKVGPTDGRKGQLSPKISTRFTSTEDALSSRYQMSGPRVVGRNDKDR